MGVHENWMGCKPGWARPQQRLTHAKKQGFGKRLLGRVYWGCSSWAVAPAGAHKGQNLADWLDWARESVMLDMRLGWN